MSETRNRYIVQHNKNDFFMIILCCMYISFIQGGLWQLFPVLNGTIAFGISIIILFVCLSDSHAREYFIYEQYGYGIVLILILSLISTIVSGYRFIGSNFMIAYYCFIIMLIGAYIKNRPDFKRVLVGYIILEILLKEIINVYELTIDSNILKYAQFNLLTTDGIGIQRLVGVGVLYSVAFLVFFSVSHIRLIKRKIIVFIWFLLSAWMMINASFTLILFTMAIISLIIFFVDSQRLEKNVLVIILIVVGIIVFLQYFLNFAINNRLFNDTVLNRLQGVNDMFFSNNTGESLLERYGNESALTASSSVQNRMVRYIQSCKAVIHNIFLGYLTPGAYSHGGHSTWLDLIAKYGILVLIYYKSIIDYQRKVFFESNSNLRKMLIAFILFYLTLGIINSFPKFYFYIQLYILIPYLYEILDNKDQYKELNYESDVDNKQANSCS